VPLYDLAIYAPGAATRYLHNAPAVGGAELQMMMLARALAARGLRVAHVLDEAEGLPKCRWGVDLVVQRPPAPGGDRFDRIRRVSQALTAADAGVYLQRSAGLVTGIVGAYARLRRRRFVYSTSSPLDLLGGLPLLPQEALGFQLGVQLADAVVVQTHDQAESARRRRGVVRIPSFCDPAPDMPTKRDFFLWVGRPAAYKRPSAFVDLAQDVPEARFVMVGVPASATSLGSAAHGREKSPPNLQILSPLPPDEVLPLYHRAIAVVNTSEFEGFPNSFMEGWARGALALSLHADPDAVITTHRLGAVAQGSRVALASAARTMWHERDEPDQRRMAAVTYVREHHSPAVVGERWFDLVTSLNRR
jgi:glycosyltransferase involved in cell wall biosynthesis